MRKIIKKIIIYCLYYSGLSLLAGFFQKNKIYCVGYHSIWDERNRDELKQSVYWNISVHATDFENQLLYMKAHGHTFLHFSDLSKPETKKLSKPTIIYFDDGFKDVLENALPILQKHSIPATVFVTTGLVEGTHMLWTLGLRYVLQKQNISTQDIEKKILEMKKMPHLTSLSPDLTPGPSPRIGEGKNAALDVFLSWSDVAFLAQNNIEIGSHSISHPKLTELSPAELTHELVESKRILEQKTSMPMTALSYPYGRHNAIVEQAAADLGYTYAMSTALGRNTFTDISDHPYSLKKISAEGVPSTYADIYFKVALYVTPTLS